VVKPQRLGHLIIGVRSVERAKAFYHGVLGLDVTIELKEPRMVLFASNLRDHHEIGCLELGENAEPIRPGQIGLNHVAFRMATEQELIEAYKRLRAANVPVECTVDHGLTHSIYLTDPDSYTVEIYCDQPCSIADVAKKPELVMGMDKLEFAPDAPALPDMMRKFGVELTKVST
jgi:catechol 2,3-dioxygenase